MAKDTENPKLKEVITTVKGQCNILLIIGSILAIAVIILLIGIKVFRHT